MSNKNHMLAAVMRLSPVIPVLVINRTADAVPIARALLAGGLKVLEITLRTPNALEVIETLAREVPEAVIAAGTVTTIKQWDDVARAGAQFAVSPGLTPALAQFAHKAAIPLLPGVATASELMTAMDAGFECFKFFPAQQAGGVAMLKALGGPFADALFCPTGGITVETAPHFLALPNVACVGGSWLAPALLVAAGDWSAIEVLAHASSGLGRLTC
ncbi:bifunctional 4-hydroxy-2-oxoglutarate aldolase/2-dehydro-3-deoxy-phosphogluconate aldolase [Aquabacterium sp.]|uniref:bifunctional 4-hydroxy-2-oxoglutarate aldolase/2-dehydro-3-deoxy-phosphogluconate aldolase n=1 Tax=Aquabacterium sp. TaxID=1872578 RepID=UPI001989790E|nr:bifunctional 4-hydroxy-2-oxoglutarate aldolase/2-dehydro-3-deoxy-phosphogluconate aldolase [Aquabacterium sp.]MBC7700423.1 bifunctional 4-hydroxy-2-oxoglutarate aldolase/2-dehydro-3-deoxy-phosphogluconate aldolase [Aquabacterium sp.]